MNRYGKAGVVLSLALLGAACDDFIQGPGLTENPNNPTGGTAQQQLIAVQARFATLLEGQLARTAGIYTQQIIGSNNQQLQVTGYSYGESDYSGFFSGFYAGGGLLAIQNVQSLSVAANDKTLEGIGLMWEGLAMGTATSIWGDLPYSEAISDILTPRLDAQEAVYAEVQNKLSEGIAALAGPPAGGCEAADLIYCAAGVTRAQQHSRWIAAANTLKARFYLDLVERNGNAAYAQALAAAQQGIAEVPTTAKQAMEGAAPGDFRTLHGGTQDVDANIWAGFLTQRGGDIRAGHTLVQLLKDRSDPRLANYFSPNAGANGEFYGLSANNTEVGGAAGEVNIPIRRAFTFRQPIVTWAENQLIMAEAKFMLTGPGDALPHVNAVRTAVGLGALGAVTFQDVMLEKYIAMFQNIAVWSDVRRTCIPALTPNGNAAEVPGRIPYGSAERTANPNLPLPSQYPTGTTGSAALRNWNDPQPCPRP